MIAPTIFALPEVRGKNLATNTIGTALRRVMAFHLSLDARGINFAGLLTSDECFRLARWNTWPASVGDTTASRPKLPSIRHSTMAVTGRIWTAIRNHEWLHFLLWHG